MFLRTDLLCNDCILPSLQKEAWVAMRGTLARNPAEQGLFEAGMGEERSLDLHMEPL